MRKYSLVAFLILMTIGRENLSGAHPAGRYTGPNVLRVNANNPRYFTDNSGKAIFLTGSHIWYNVQDQSGRPPLDFANYLSWMVSTGHNFVRLWQMDEPWTTLVDNTGQGAMTPLPFARVPGHGTAADGGLKFDLSQYDENYFDRLRANVILAGSKGVYCSVMLFNGWWAEGQPSNFSTSHHNPSNNINGLSMSVEDVYTMNNPSWVALMDAYAMKVVDSVGDLDNIVYEISNETPYSSKAWQYHLIDHIHAYEITKGKRHPVGMTSFAFASGGYATNADLYASNADWVSIYGGSGSNYTTEVVAAPGTKVQILDTDHIRGVTSPADDNGAWVWRSLIRGHNPIYMDPLDYFPAYPADSDLQSAMGYAQRLANRIDLDHMVPSDISTSTRYALVNLNAEYLVYQPSNTSFTVNLPAQTFAYEWINPATGDITQSGILSAVAGNNVFALPSGYSQGALLHLVRVSADSGTLN